MGQSELQRLHCADGRDPEGDRLLAGHRGRTDESAGEGSALQVFRRRQGPRRDHGVHQQSPRLDSGADAARVQQGGQSEHGGEAAPARRRARCAWLRTAARDRSTARSPGDIWINLRTTDLHSKYSLADLTFHEAIPGHIWQGEYTHDMPLIRQMLAFNAYSEGWGLYAEQLADELGAYESDPVGRLGYLQSIAFRACRLVVDTGIHAKRWTREQGVQFFVDVNGSNPEEVASEVDRYCSWPGQACGYKVGHSEINRQREKADDGARAEVRCQGVQRYRGARRQRAARRAREERRRIYPQRHELVAGPARVGRRWHWVGASSWASRHLERTGAGPKPPLRATSTRWGPGKARATGTPTLRTTTTPARQDVRPPAARRRGDQPKAPSQARCSGSRGTG